MDIVIGHTIPVNRDRANQKDPSDSAKKKKKRIGGKRLKESTLKSRMRKFRDGAWDGPTKWELKQQLDAASSDFKSFDERLALFGKRVMPAAEATVEATRQAYRNDVAPFDELVRAEKTLLDARTRLLRLRAGRLLAQADLLYLTGETP